MSKLLIDQLRKQRELTVKVDSFTFTARRPTDVEMAELQRNQKFSELGMKFVIGWDGVTEDDIIGGGGSDVVPFDPALWSEMYADRPDLWTPISQAILDAYGAHTQKLAGAAKNSPPG